MVQSSLLGFFDRDLKRKDHRRPCIKEARQSKDFLHKHSNTTSSCTRTYQRRSKRKTIPDENEKVQQFLQVGQKTKVALKCPVCGMMYTRGLEEDEALHTTFHKQYLRQMILPVG